MSPNNFTKGYAALLAHRNPQLLIITQLLQLASLEFDVFVTADQGLQYQQDLSGYDIAVVTLVARTNRLEDLKPIVPRLLEVLPALKAGEVVSLAA